jgi:hypothetical protein
VRGFGVRWKQNMTTWIGSKILFMSR